MEYGIVMAGKCFIIINLPRQQDIGLAKSSQ